jgi:3-methyl-2-oxobutanoate hydroxymethyltransferase
MVKHKKTSRDILARKANGPKIATVTAYDVTFARLFDEAGVDILLVGDSLGMVVQGHDTTLPVTLDEMIYHARAVARAKPSAHLVLDMPFMSYQASVESALVAAGRALKESGCEAVKLEGGAAIVPQVAACVAAGIPVMGHLGLTPQSVHALGGFRVQGRTVEDRQRMVHDAQALAQAGAYAIVLEGIPADLAAQITQAVPIPTIGIYAGPHCDGQVLVCYDLLGLQPNLKLRFVKRYAEFGQAAIDATRQYIGDVQSGKFPDDAHSPAVNHEA